MSNSVYIQLGYGFNLGWSKKIPQTWKRWDGVEKYMSLMDYFESFPGDPVIVISYSGSCYANDMQEHVVIDESTKSADYGDPLILNPKEMLVPQQWKTRLLEVAKAMGVDITEKDLTWLVSAHYG